MLQEDFNSILIRLERVIQILKEEGHPPEQQAARREELRALVEIIRHGKYV